MKKILFVCTYHGGRALMAEQFARALHVPGIEVASACFEEGLVSPRIYRLLAEKGLAVDGEKPVPVWDRYNRGERYDVVVTLCNDASAEMCPVFNANIDTLYGRMARIVRWVIPDFASLQGPEEKWLAQARDVRDLIAYRVGQLLRELGEDGA